MTRKHFARIAWDLRQTHPRSLGYDPGSDEYFYREREWLTVARCIAETCAASNGRFDRDRFERACGLAIRPDGSLWPMTPPR